MKSIITLYFIICSLTLFSQKSAMNICQKQIQINQCTEDILKILNGYQYNYTDTIDKYQTAFVYKNNEGDLLAFIYQRTVEGANPDLKKQGITYYTLKTIKAQFLTLYKIYTDYYGRNITVDQLKKNEDYWHVSKNGVSYYFEVAKSSQPGYWQIRF